MWGFEHTAMAAVFAMFSAFLVYRRNYLWLGATVLSQVPFWCGFGAYMVSGDPSPVDMNLAVNLIAAGVFVEWGHKLQGRNSGGVVHIWLGKLFIFAGVLDILQVVFEYPGYILSQELVHYSAFILIGGRAYVRKFDGSHRRDRDSLRSSTGGGLV
jgi:hypothetical protein